MQQRWTGADRLMKEAYPRRFNPDDFNNLQEGGGGGFDNYGGELSLHSINLSDVSAETHIIARFVRGSVLPRQSMLLFIRAS
jgi:hypothetical protein